MRHGRGREKTKPIPLLRIGDRAAPGRLPAPCCRWSAWPIVQTNPICGSRPGRPWYSWAGRLCYGTPCGVTTNRAPASNKLNLGHSKVRCKCLAEKELWRIRPVRGNGKTKPIPGQARNAQGPARPPLPVAGTVVQTNPISATMPIGRSAVPGENRAKQTQFRRE